MCLKSVFVLTLLTVIAVNSAAQTEINLKIIGGQEATAHAFPYQVGIATRRLPPPERSGWCGGALISQKFVLTAAHCLKGIQEATVFLGTHDVHNFSSNPQAISMVIHRHDMLVHTHWSPRYVVNDIALIQLPETVLLSESIQPINLPSVNFAVPLGESLLATGWGRTSRNVTISRPSKLHFVELKVEPDDTCKGVFFYYNATLNICLAGEPKMTICRGDSGGPIVATEGGTGKRVLVGITSYGRKCENVSVLTRVTAFLDWIAENTSTRSINLM